MQIDYHIFKQLLNKAVRLNSYYSVLTYIKNTMTTMYLKPTLYKRSVISKLITHIKIKIWLNTRHSYCVTS